MSNSSLINCSYISPTTYGYRGIPTKITIHHAAGNIDLKTVGEMFQDPQRRASASYCIDSIGSISLNLPECYAPCTSSSYENDWQAVTIEVANDGGEETNWHVSDDAISSLINLCVDICKRNNIKNLIYSGDSSGNLTRHNMFAPTTCPGPYLQSKFPYIAQKVNERLQEDEPMTAAEKQEFSQLKYAVDKLSQENETLKQRLDTYDKMGVYDNAAIRWAYIDKNMPDWATPTIKKCVNKGWLKGGDKNSFELSRLMMRILVILDRAGILGE